MLRAQSVHANKIHIIINGILLRDVQLLRERWVRWFHTLLNPKSPRLDPNIPESLDQWTENMSLLIGVKHTVQELTDTIRSSANGKSVGPDGISVELFKIGLNGNPALRRRLLDIDVRIWRDGEMPQQWKDAILEVIHKKKKGLDRVWQLQEYLAGSARRQDTENHRSSQYCESVGILPEQQNGCRPNRSTTVMMSVIRRLQELAWRGRNEFRCIYALSTVFRIYGCLYALIKGAIQRANAGDGGKRRAA